MRAMLLAAALSIAGQAMSGFYLAGCLYTDERTQMPLTESQAAARCEDWRVRARATLGAEECVGEFNAWTACTAEARAPSCCNATYTDLVNCLPI